MVKQKICIKKTNTFAIIDMNFVQEQLKSQCNRFRTIAECLVSSLTSCRLGRLSYTTIEWKEREGGWAAKLER